ncbi:MAG: adaptor protein MecA [Lachnospiraceae bacterium]|nr:adaptor protein MecA [Lachnospiraceae bacterium]
MEFSREGKNTIRCVITEEEIEELGYTMDEIISNGVRTQEFMNEIFDLAEQEFDMKFDMGVKTVRADFLPNRTLALTFSEHPVTSEGMMEHLKEIVNGLLSSIPQKKETLKPFQRLEELKEDIEDDKKVIILFLFMELDILIRFAKQITQKKLPYNDLYKFDEVYFLMMDLSDGTGDEIRHLSNLMEEYVTDAFSGADKRAFIYEHGTPILKDHAIEQLRQL